MSCSSVVLFSAACQALLRKGLPPEYRPEVWWSVLGCDAVKLRSPKSYQQYLEETVDAATSATIECDLPRTFPNHKKLRWQQGRLAGGSKCFGPMRSPNCQSWRSFFGVFELGPE